MPLVTSNVRLQKMNDIGVAVVFLEGYLVLLFLALTLWAFDIYPFDEKNLGSFFSGMSNGARSFSKVAAPIVLIYKSYVLVSLIV